MSSSSPFHLKLNKSALNLNLNLTTTSSSINTSSMLIQKENNFNRNYLPFKPKPKLKSHSKPIIHPTSPTLTITNPIHNHQPHHSLLNLTSISKSSSNIFNQPLHTITYCTSTNPISKAYTSFYHSRKNRSNTHTSFITPALTTSNTAHIKQQIKYLQMQTSPNVSYSHLPSTKKLQSVGLNLSGKLLSDNKDKCIQKEIHKYAKKILLNEYIPLTKNKPVVKVRKENVNKVYYDKISPVNKNINFLVGKQGSTGNTRNCGSYGRKYKVLKQKSIEDKEIEKFMNEFNNGGYYVHRSNNNNNGNKGNTSTSGITHVNVNVNNNNNNNTKHVMLKRNKSFTYTKPINTFTNQNTNMNTNINDKVKQMYLLSYFNKPVNTLNDL